MSRARRAWALAIPTLLALTTPARGSDRQLHGGIGLGGEWSDARRGGVGGLVALHGALDLTDTWRIYGALQYGLSAADASNTPRHEGTLAAGIAYRIDVLSIVPWVGLGLEASLVSTPAWTGFVPLGEARGGIDYFAARWWGLTLQVAYGIAFANRNEVADVLNGFLAVRFTTDL